MKTHLKFLVSGSVLLFIAVSLSLVAQTTVYAADPPGTIEIPANQAAKRGAKSNTVTVKINKDKQEQANAIVIEQKNYKSAQNQNDRRELRITKIKYKQKKPPAPNNSTYLEVTQSPAPGTTSEIAIPSDCDMSEPIEVTFTLHSYTADDTVGAEMPAAGDGVEVNFKVTNAAGAFICNDNVGPGAVMLSATGSPTVIGFAQTEMGFLATDYEQPDLIMYSSSVPRVGDIRFIPVGQFRFSEVPQEVHIFDGEGTNLNGGPITLGDAWISARGEVVIPVTEVSTTLPSFALMVRGVQVSLDDDISTDTKHCYTVSGSALVENEADAAVIVDGTRILDNWEFVSWSPAFKLTGAIVPVWDEVLEQPVDWSVGQDTARVISNTTDNMGYLDGIVLESNSAGMLHTGKVYFRPLHGFQFLEDGNTKLYVINTANGANVSEEVEATIDVTSNGSLIVNLLDLGDAASLMLRLVIINPKVSFDSPMDWGVGYGMNVYGPAVRGALARNFTVLEGYHLDTEDEPTPLTTTAISVHGWTTAAVMDPAD